MTPSRANFSSVSKRARRRLDRYHASFAVLAFARPAQLKPGTLGGRSNADRMFTPNDIDYTRFDVGAMLETRGIATVDQLRATPCQHWLEQRGYVVSSVDFGLPFKEVLAQLG